jgi:hypothetical protein
MMGALITAIADIFSAIASSIIGKHTKDKGDDK